MKNFLKITMLTAFLAALLLAGCSIDTPSDPTGTVNPPGLQDARSRYVAIGNSLTAGWMDNGLMQVGQSGSYPQRIASMLGLDVTEFSQPWIAAPGISGASASDPTVINGVLRFDGTGLTLLGTTPATDVQSTLLLAISQPTAYHNMGVPGADLIDGMNAYDAASGSGNPFFNFINRSAFFGNTPVPLSAGPPPIITQSGSMHYKAIAKGAALATVWLGNNDILGPATGGNPTAADLIDKLPEFTANYTAMLSTLAGGLAIGNGFPPTIVTANIPSVTSAAFFMPEPVFVAAVGGAWPFGYDETDVQIVLFTALGWVAANPGLALPSNYTLTGQEIADVEAATVAFNATISGITQSINASGVAKCGMVDANAALAGLAPAQGTHFLLLLGQGLDITTAAATTYFGLDGVHPNSLGYASTANLFIDMINSLDGTNIPSVDMGSVIWDPTYGVPIALPKDDWDGKITMSPEVTDSLTRVFR